ncbi:CCA tRNA nucleotidyltransferase [Staphylococcus kloosii]|uniref:CCA tRNA nucleotidyltransferase n=1 Tax=Staphylococcus kloosii TaxID=29384 RepID=UPI001E4FB713|nr:CCA tRNA nucleotidyltransferase [Staphylococcus kloosii]MCD8878651.1 CCA tRNA nucleotidyltransferase [Staphylococcus kloosii]
MTNILFEDAKPIIKKIKEQGFEAYFVGGSVRDYLMNKDIHDIDITTSATPDEIESIFPKTVPIGKEHGTINVLFNNSSYEITTFRTEEEYVNHRKPNGVVFVRDLYEDVKRRDFTINAIAMDEEYTIIDYFNGKADIEAENIKTVGHAEERFEEDALRIIRGLRFQSQLAFTLDNKTFEGMQSKIQNIEYLSIERIIVEFKKLFSGKNVAVSYNNLIRLNAFSYIPFFSSYNMTKININEPLPFNLFIALIQHKLTNDNAQLSHLKISNNEKKEIQTYNNLLTSLQNINTKQQLKLLIYDYGLHYNLTILSYSETLKQNEITLPSPIIYNEQLIREVAHEMPINNRLDIDISGKDLIDSLQQRSGPWIKEALRNIEIAIIDGQLTNFKPKILEWVKEHVKI